jgi:uncharacterized protein YhdP
MKRAFKLAGYLGAAVMLFFAAGAFALYHLARTGEFRNYLIAAVEQHAGLKLQLGAADLELGAILGLSFRDVALAEADLGAPELTAERITARVAFWPLLKRQVVFNEVRLRRPVLRLARDPNGKIHFVERLLNVPFLKTKGAEFQLDVHSVKINNGRFEFADARPGGADPVITRFQDVALELESVRAAALKEALRAWARPADGAPEGAALQLELAAVVERDLARVNWRARGRLVFPEHQLALARAWCDLDMQVEGAPAAVAKISGAPLPALRAVDGALASRFQLRGNLSQRLELKGAVDFQRLSIDAPELFTGPVSAGSGRVRIETQFQPELWTINRLNFRSEDLDVEITGQVHRPAEADARLDLEIHADPLPLAVLRKYMPVKWLASGAIDEGLDAFTAGDLYIRKAGVNTRLAAMRGGASDPGSDSFRLDGEIRRGAATLPAGYPPLTGISARFNFDNGRLSFWNLSASAGQSWITEAHGTYSLQPGSHHLDLRARGAADLGELRELGRRGLLSAELNRAAAAVQNLAGRSMFDIGFARLADGTQQTQGVLGLEKARLQWDLYSFTEVEGELIFTPAEIKTEKMTGLLHGSPLELRGVLRQYSTADASFDLVVESPGIRAGIVSKLLLEQGSLQDAGIVRGSLRYRGPLEGKQERNLTGTLELVNVQLPVFPLKQPLRQLNGKISIDESGIDFQGLKGLLVGVPASASGRWRYTQKPQLRFDFSAPSVDLDYLMSQIDPESTPFYETLQAEGDVRLARGRIDTLEFSDLRSRLILDRRTWRFPNLSLRAGSGSVSGPLTIAHKPDTIEIVAAPHLRSVPMTTLLRWFEITQSEITGTADVTGKFDTSGADAAERKHNLNGRFSLKIADGTIHRMRILVQFLNVLDLSRWFTLQLPDLSKQGIRFRAITGDFKISQGVYYTDNLIVDSDDLRMTGVGKIDVAGDQVDLLVAVRPFAGIDAAIRHIPLIGRGIAAVKNSFLVASFNIKGPIDEPAITPAPLGTLSEWVLGVLRIPKSLIPFTGEEKDTGKLSAEDELRGAQP